jgi:hypothetical protein
MPSSATSKDRELWLNLPPLSSVLHQAPCVYVSRLAVFNSQRLVRIPPNTEPQHRNRAERVAAPLFLLYIPCTNASCSLSTVVVGEKLERVMIYRRLTCTSVPNSPSHSSSSQFNMKFSILAHFAFLSSCFAANGHDEDEGPDINLEDKFSTFLTSSNWAEQIGESKKSTLLCLDLMTP